MTAPRCARLWQVEAVRDRRLAGPDRAAFERHLATCSECTLELAAFERLEELSARLPVPSSDPLARRRLRNELLRRANDLSLGTGRPPARRRNFVVLAAALAAALMIVFVTWRRSDDSAVLAVGEPRFEVVSAPGSQWSTLRHGAALRLALSRGHVDVSVHKLRAGQSFVLELPDGEIEVRGTRFAVDVVDRKTRGVVVREGLVALRWRDSGRELLLGAGQAWTAATPPASATAKATRVPPQPSDRGAPTLPLAPAPAKSAAPARPQASAPKPGATSGATEEFAAAMAAFSSGDYATAERLFLAFEAHYPTNGHVEDTMFLRALTRLRRGDETGAKALARQYLARYPNGFRAPEAQRITR